MGTLILMMNHMTATHINTLKTARARTACRPWYGATSFLANVNSRPLLCYRPSVCRLYVTSVHPTQPVEIFGNISSPFGTLAIP